MSNDWDRTVERFREDLEREISATPTSERRNLLSQINIDLMRVQDMDSAKKLEVGGN